MSESAKKLAGLLNLPAGQATDTHLENVAREVCHLLGAAAKQQLRRKVKHWPQLVEEAEDLCQLAALAFIEAYRQGKIRPDEAAGVHTPGSVQAYLWGICSRLFLQAVRRSQARPTVDSAAPATTAPAQESSGFKELLSGGPQDDDESRLWEVLAAVDNRCRPEDIIVTWLHCCGFTIAELQRLLRISRNIPANAVKRVGQAVRSLLGLSDAEVQAANAQPPASRQAAPPKHQLNPARTADSPFALLTAKRFGELLDSLADPAARGLLLREAAAQLGPPAGMAAASLDESLAARQFSVRASGDWSWGLLSAKERRALLARDAALLRGAGVPDAGIAQQAALKKLVAEMSSIFSELDEALLGDDLAWLLPLADHIYPLLEITSEFKEMQQRYGVFLEAAQRLESPRLELLAQLGLCRAQWRLGDYDGARLAGQSARELALRLGDRHGEALSFNGLGNVEWLQGNFRAARELHAQALAIRCSIGDRHGVANSLVNLGNAVHGLGNFSGARETFGQALAIKRSLGDRYGEADCLMNLGIVDMQQGNYSAARELYGKALDIKRGLDDRHGEAACVCYLGILEWYQNNYSVARELLGEALATNREIGDRAEESICLSLLGAVEYMEGNFSAANELYAQTLAILKELRNKVNLSWTCSECGAVLAALGCLRPAALAIYGTLANNVGISCLFPPEGQRVHEGGLARLDAAVASGEISAEELAQWKAEGEAMSLDELAEFTLAALADAASLDHGPAHGKG